MAIQLDYQLSVHPTLYVRNARSKIKKDLEALIREHNPEEPKIIVNVEIDKDKDMVANDYEPAVGVADYDLHISDSQQYEMEDEHILESAINEFNCEVVGYYFFNSYKKEDKT